MTVSELINQLQTLNPSDIILCQYYDFEYFKNEFELTLDENYTEEYRPLVCDNDIRECMKEMEQCYLSNGVLHPEAVANFVTNFIEDMQNETV